ncbi:hypothetical protein DFH27DRAFT_600778 [Peziza echinospora]|nr:hypothetical protein DFH27DRAFT_600778 [Peziza echinospora]
MSRRTRALSARRGTSPGGRTSRRGIEANGTPEPLSVHDDVGEMEEMDSGHPQLPFLSLMKLLEISSSSGQTANLLALSPPESPEMMNLNHFHYTQPRITILEPGAVTEVPLPMATKRRLFHFLYAAERPLTLAEFSLIPTINTDAQAFEPEHLLRLRPGSATYHLSNWFGMAVKYSFSSAGGFVEVSEEYFHMIQKTGSMPAHYPPAFGDVFVSREEAHAETLLVCAAYLSLSNGGSGGADNLSGLGFLYSDDNDLSEIMERIERESQQGALNTSHNVPAMPYFYSLWTYATLHWPRHLARITVPECYGMIRATSVNSTIAARRISSFLLSSHTLTWLENLSNVLHSTNNSDSESMALAQAHMYGIYQRWLQSRINIDCPELIKLYARTMHWISSLNSIDILAQIQNVTDLHTPAYGATARPPQQRKMEICKLIQSELHKAQAFDEAMSMHDCELIANNKMDIDSQKSALAFMAGCKEPCIYDPSRRVLFYVDQKCWSGGSLQLECIDLETGLILGRDWTWTKKFARWRYRIIVAKSKSHLAFQVAAERPANDDRMQRLLITYVTQLKNFEKCRLGENVLQAGWLVDDDVYDILSDGGAYGSKQYPNLVETGHLVFSPDGSSLQTPSGVWDLQTRKKISECIVTPTLIAVSPDGIHRVHAELDLYQNCYSKLLIRDNNSGHSQQIMGADGLVALPESTKAFSCRYIGFSLCGTKFMAQIECLEAYRPKELVWLVWEKEQDLWEVKRRVLGDHTQFWPFAKFSPWSKQEIGVGDGADGKWHILWNMGSILSVHRPVAIQVRQI